MPIGLSQHIASQALMATDPFVRQLMRSGIVKRDHLHIIVAKRISLAGEFFVLKEQSFGEGADWANDYDAIARAKLEIAARTGLSSRQVRQMQPELLEDGDTAFWGSVILGNIIVACSGVQPWFDELIANTVAGTCRALIQDEVEGKVLRMKGSDFRFSDVDD